MRNLKKKDKKYRFVKLDLAFFHKSFAVRRKIFNDQVKIIVILKVTRKNDDEKAFHQGY